MKYDAFHDSRKKSSVIFFGIMFVILLLALIIIYHTYAVYQEQHDFDVLKGMVPNQNYDVMFSFVIEDEKGMKTFVSEMPEDRNYLVNITCDKDAEGYWDYEEWAPKIRNLTKARTKCMLTFSPSTPLGRFGIYDMTTTSGDGLYEVKHFASEFTTDLSDNLMEEEINNLKQTEYRYAGKNPNNYVKFNNELWRIIGLVNTPEGQRLKIIRNESIGDYSWDSSELAVNGGFGVNEWSQADSMLLLNHSVYYNRGKGICYNGQNNATLSCDFSSNGLMDESKKKIDTITWNIGASLWMSEDVEITPVQFYNYERSSFTGKNLCNGGGNCNDTVTRTTTWKGQVGLMYPSDYGYATSGSSYDHRSVCLNSNMFQWNNQSDCYINDWLWNGAAQWTIVSQSDSVRAYRVFSVTDNGKLYRGAAYGNISIRPTIYLKTKVRVMNGSGTIDSPYLFI